MRALAVILLSAAAFGQNANQVRDRGQTRPQDESQRPLRKDIQNYAGILVDATCGDRSSLNLRERPMPQTMATAPSPPGGAEGSASGVSVDAKTMQNERADALAHQTADLKSRQPDPTCAVTGSTREFALLLPNGRLLNLDEGGTTYATQMLQSLPEGRALLNGTGGGVKPQVTFRGRVLGDRLFVEKVMKP